MTVATCADVKSLYERSGQFGTASAKSAIPPTVKIQSKIPLTPELAASILQRATTTSSHSLHHSGGRMPNIPIENSELVAAMRFLMKVGIDITKYERSVDTRRAYYRSLRTGMVDDSDRTVVRNEKQLPLSTVEGMLNFGLRRLEPERLESILKSYDPALVKAASQYATFDSLAAFRASVLCEAGDSMVAWLPQRGTLSDVLGYVGNKKDAIGGSWPSSHELYQCNTIILDSATTVFLQDQPHLVELIKKNKMRVVVPLGLEDGVHLFMPQRQIRPTLSKISAAVAGQSGDKNLGQAVARYFSDIADSRLSASPQTSWMLAPDSPCSLVKIADLWGHRISFSDLLNGHKRVETKDLQAVFDAAVQKSGTKHHALANNLLREVVTQEAAAINAASIGELCLEAAGLIENVLPIADRKPDDLYLYLPDSGSSFEICAFAYQLACGVRADHVLNRNDMESNSFAWQNAKAILMVDDFAGTGNTLVRYSQELREANFDGSILIAPLLGTDIAHIKLANVTVSKDLPDWKDPDAAGIFSYAIGSIFKSSFFKGLSEQNQALLTSLLGNLGYGKTASFILLPWGSPNNNCSLGAEIARIAAPSSKSVKSPYDRNT